MYQLAKLRVLENAAVSMHYKGHQAALSVVRDVTEHRKAEDEVRG